MHEAREARHKNNPGDLKSSIRGLTHLIQWISGVITMVLSGIMGVVTMVSEIFQPFSIETIVITNYGP